MRWLIGEVSLARLPGRQKCLHCLPDTNSHSEKFQDSLRGVFSVSQELGYIHLVRKAVELQSACQAHTELPSLGSRYQDALDLYR